MKFSTACLILGGAVTGASLHGSNRYHENYKRDLEIVTVTDVVWEVVTVTEYDDSDAATTAPVAFETPAAIPTTPVETPATSTVVQQDPIVPTTSSAVVAGNTAQAQQAVSIATSATPVAAPQEQQTVVVAGPAEAPQTTAVAPAAAAATPATSSLPAEAASSGQFSGDETFYELGLTACGQTYTDSDYVAAISYKLFDQDGTADPNSELLATITAGLWTDFIDNPHCGKKIRVFRDGKSVDVTIVDRCAGCENMYSVDLSPIAFNLLATPSEGRVPITWDYL